MENISDDVRNRRQFCKVRVSFCYNRCSPEFEQIWHYLEEHNRQNGGQWDNDLVKIFFALGTDFAKIGDYVEGLLKNPTAVPLSLAAEASNSCIAMQLDNMSISSHDSLRHRPIVLSSNRRHALILKPSEKWIKTTGVFGNFDDQEKFCDSDLVKQIGIEKNSLENFTDKQKYLARKRSNPYETVKSGMFQSREAIKLAALDKMFNFELSNEGDAGHRRARNPVGLGVFPRNTSRRNPIFYFADICGGPGAHCEYLLWRKGYYNAKGFGFTMKKNNDSLGGNFGDYKPENFIPSSYAFVDTYYGVKDDGNIYDPDNLISLENYIKERTDGHGVHLVVADGAVDPTGREMEQEIIHKRIFVGEFIAALSLCKVGEGNFVCKVYDTLTSFTVGLIYLMYASFSSIAICKPAAVRPACSEQFLVCRKLTEFGATVIKNHLIAVNKAFESLPFGKTIVEVIPQKFIDMDHRFLDFILSHNRCTLQRQIKALRFYKECVFNPSKSLTDQSIRRLEALKYWDLAEVERSDFVVTHDIQLLFRGLCGNFNIWNFRKLPKLSCFSICEELGERQMIFDEYVFQELSTEHQILIVADQLGRIHTFEPHKSKIERITGTKAHDFPPCTVLLVQKTDRLFHETSSLKILDAAVLSGDKVYKFTLARRLECAKKFAETAIIRYQHFRIPVEVMPIASLHSRDVEKIPTSCSLLKVIRIFKEDHHKAKNANGVTTMVLKPSMTAVPEIGTESNFWNCLTSASFQCDRDSLLTYTHNIGGFCDENDSST